MFYCKITEYKEILEDSRFLVKAFESFLKIEEQVALDELGILNEVYALFRQELPRFAGKKEYAQSVAAQFEALSIYQIQENISQYKKQKTVRVSEPASVEYIASDKYVTDPLKMIPPAIDLWPDLNQDLASALKQIKSTVGITCILFLTLSMSFLYRKTQELQGLYAIKNAISKIEENDLKKSKHAIQIRKMMIEDLRKNLQYFKNKLTGEKSRSELFQNYQGFYEYLETVEQGLDFVSLDLPLFVQTNDYLDEMILDLDANFDRYLKEVPERLYFGPLRSRSQTSLSGFEGAREMSFDINSFTFADKAVTQQSIKSLLLRLSTRSVSLRLAILHSSVAHLAVLNPMRRAQELNQIENTIKTIFISISICRSHIAKHKEKKVQEALYLMLADIESEVQTLQKRFDETFSR